MSLLGPIVVVAEEPDTLLVQALAKAGAHPVVEARWCDAPSVVSSVNPGAVVIADLAAANSTFADALAERIAQSEPFLPMIARLHDDDRVLPGTLPVPADAPPERLAARVALALRLRTLHATVLDGARMLKSERNIVADIPADDPIEDATVLVIGRGASHAALGVAVGERMGVMGALSVEAAARCLSAREIDGVVLGDGLPVRGVAAFLMLLDQEPRFRDLPVAMLGRTADFRMPRNFVQARDPENLVERLLPLVRLHAFEARLRRLLKSIECQGALDARTGLLTIEAFGHELVGAINNAGERGLALSLARFSFEQAVDRRASRDAARIASRLARELDFACRDDDGSLLFAFTETDLKAAHVVARRLASALKHTMLKPEHGLNMGPSLILATLKPSDTVFTLLSRVALHPVAAA